MSVVTVLKPVVRLARLLREPGGTALVDALATAKTNLETASEGYLDALAEGLVDLAGAAGQNPSNTFDEAVFSRLYSRANGLIGAASVCGRASIDEALTSLCELLDSFQARGTWDREAIGVHIDSLRLLLHGGVEEGSAGAAAILEGLRQVSRRYQIDAAAG